MSTKRVVASVCVERFFSLSFFLNKKSEVEILCVEKQDSGLHPDQLHPCVFGEKIVMFSNSIHLTGCFVLSHWPKRVKSKRTYLVTQTKGCSRVSFRFLQKQGLRKTDNKGAALR